MKTQIFLIVTIISIGVLFCNMIFAQDDQLVVPQPFENDNVILPEGEEGENSTEYETDEEDDRVNIRDRSDSYQPPETIEESTNPSYQDEY